MFFDFGVCTRTAGGRLAAVSLPALLALSALAATWTDRNEYDLTLAIRSEAVPKKKLELLDQWKAKYPKTDLRQQRRELYLSVYQSLGDSTKMLETAREMISDQPDNLVGLYWCAVLIPGTKDPAPDLLSLGEKAANQLLSGIDGYFSPAKKPASATDNDWKIRKSAVTLLSHRDLGWIHWQQGNYPAAESEFSIYLQQNPNAAEISAWFGTMSALQKLPEKQVAALWHLARAAGIRGDGALGEPQQRQISGLLEKLYIFYHGDSGGLDQLRTNALTAPLPPADFTIESAASIADSKRMEDLERTNPELAAWLRIRKRLDAPDGDKYFTESLHNSRLPKLKGTVIRSSPAGKPEEIVLGMSDAVSEEVVLKLSSTFPNEAPAGLQLTFEGTAESFSQKPFSLTVVVDRDKVQRGTQAQPARR